jgi:hypothetical protein
MKAALNPRLHWSMACLSIHTARFIVLRFPLRVSTYIQVRGTKWLQADLCMAPADDFSGPEALTALASDNNIDVTIIASFKGKRGDKL